MQERIKLHFKLWYNKKRETKPERIQPGNIVDKTLVVHVLSPGLLDSHFPPQLQIAFPVACPTEPTLFKRRLTPESNRHSLFLKPFYSPPSKCSFFSENAPLHHIIISKTIQFFKMRPSSFPPSYIDVALPIHRRTISECKAPKETHT